MIFYFSGTGNSLYVAKKIGEAQRETVINIATVVNKGGPFEYTLHGNEVVGFIFPLYAFSAPKMVFDFIEKLQLNNLKGNYIFAVATYGQNIGRFDKFLNKPLKEKGWTLCSGFSVNMPNNWFFIWDKDKQAQCLEEAEKTIARVNDAVRARDNTFEIHTTLRSEIIGPIASKQYNKTVQDTKNFYANDKCISCGLCEKVCNGQCIKVDGKPAWTDKCTKCFACIHLCPTKALQFSEMGNTTEIQGRYKNPNISVGELVTIP